MVSLGLLDAVSNVSANYLFLCLINSKPLAKTELRTVGSGHLACEQVIYSSNQCLCRLDILHLCVRQPIVTHQRKDSLYFMSVKWHFVWLYTGCFPTHWYLVQLMGTAAYVGRGGWIAAVAGSHKRQAMSHRYLCIQSHRHCYCSTPTVLVASINQRGNVYRFAFEILHCF